MATRVPKGVRPCPNVDSALVAFQRRPGVVFGEEWDRLAERVHGAFAHRRKTVANSLALAGLEPPTADQASRRAEQLAPPEFLTL